MKKKEKRIILVCIIWKVVLVSVFLLLLLGKASNQLRQPTSAIAFAIVRSGNGNDSLSSTSAICISFARTQELKVKKKKHIYTIVYI